MSTISVILMVKNEKNSIKITIDSVKNYIKNIIVLDTGSTDNTIEIIRQTSKKNNYLTVYSEDYQETLKILVISNKSFRIIDGDYWIEECPYKINGTYYK